MGKCPPCPPSSAAPGLSTYKSDSIIGLALRNITSSFPCGFYWVNSWLKILAYLFTFILYANITVFELTPKIYLLICIDQSYGEFIRRPMYVYKGANRCHCSQRWGWVTREIVQDADSCCCLCWLVTTQSVVLWSIAHFSPGLAQPSHHQTAETRRSNPTNGTHPALLSCNSTSVSLTKNMN